MLSFFAKNVGIVVGLTYVESKFVSGHGTNNNAGLPSYFGLTPLALSSFCLWTVLFSFKVGAARTKYAALAKDDQEENVDERYALPNLYVTPCTSKHSKAFNCVQRAHQHIFETFTQVVATSLIGALSYPVTSFLLLDLYCIGRSVMSYSYANSEGEPSKRYESKFAMLTWYGLIGSTLLAILSSVKLCLSPGGKLLKYW